jgi:uncharacterized protein (TIGR03437 family)
MSILSVPFLSRNRYTVAVTSLACAFLVASCNDCFVDQEFSSSCLSQGGAPIFGDFAKGARDLPGESAVIFEPNLGQADASFAFVSSSGGVNMRLNSQEAMIEFPARKGEAAYSVHAVLTGARAVGAVGLSPLQSRTNYLIGNDRSRWLTGVANYGQVKFSGVYPGIDVVYHGSGNRLEHDFVVAPGADPSQIRLSFAGASDVTVTPDGALEMEVNGRKLAWLKPALYQSDAKGKPSRAVEGRYKTEPDGAVRFEVGSYDRNKPLTIDPVLAYATYFGGSASESATRVAVDAGGNSYFTGGTTDISFGVSANAFKAGSAFPAGDAIVVKLSADGKTVLYTTHFGGTGADVGLGIALDASSNIYVTGMTWSSDFPVSTGAIQTKIATGTFGGNNRMCFVSKLNNAGTALQYSTYLGGSDGDTTCTGIGVDSTGNAYVSGATYANNYPTVNAFQPKYTSTGMMPFDAFVSKVSPDGTKLLYSTYLGGSGTSGATAIAVDAAGNAYVTGATTSRDFPVTAGAYQTTYAGAGGQRISIISSGDAFVTKMDTTGKLLYSTFLGGSKDDIGIGIAIDAAGNAYVAGSTMSPNFPTVSPYQSSYKGSAGDINYTSGDGFVAKLNPQGSALIFSTYLGGSKDDRASAIGLDPSGNIFVAGNTFSSDFPVTPDAKQPTFGGENANDSYRTGDAFFTQLSPAGALVSSTYFGGSGTDFAAGLAVDSQGSIVVVGGTDSSNLFTTAGALQTKFGGATGDYLPAGDAFIIKFSAAAAVPTNSIAAVVNSASYAAGSVSPGEIVTVAGTGIGPDALQTSQIVSNQFQTRVGNTRILFDGVPAPVIYVSARQDAVVVPYSVAGKTQTVVTAEYNGMTSPGFPLPVSAVVPGLFSADSTGNGQGAILNQDNSYNSPATPAARGSIVLLYGTGEGQTTPAGIDGSIALSVFPKPLLPMSVILAGQTVDPAFVLYAGAAPSSIAGFFQVNVKIPCSVKAGSVSAVVQVGTVQSQKGLTVAVRDPTQAENYCPAQP